MLALTSLCVSGNETYRSTEGDLTFKVYSMEQNLHSKLFYIITVYFCTEAAQSMICHTLYLFLCCSQNSSRGKSFYFFYEPVCLQSAGSLALFFILNSITINASESKQTSRLLNAFRLCSVTFHSLEIGT